MWEACHDDDDDDGGGGGGGFVVEFTDECREEGGLRGQVEVGATRGGAAGGGGGEGEEEEGGEGGGGGEDPGVRAQVSFLGRAACARFVLNTRFMHVVPRVVCADCSAELSEHTSEAVSDDDLAACLAARDRLLAPAVADCVVDADEGPPSSETSAAGGLGRVYVGSYRASVQPFVGAHGISAVVNASDLHLSPRADHRAWAAAVEALEADEGLLVLRLGWIDDPAQRLWAHERFDQLVEAVGFVHHARRGGRNVLLHCVQGQSRSGTVAVAYVMARDRRAAADSLREVQRRRPLVLPNAGFMDQLREFEHSRALARLRKEIGINEPAA